MTIDQGQHLPTPQTESDAQNFGCQGRTVIHIGTKDQFLNTTPNKEALIRLISDKLCQNGCKVVQASGDADIDIVEAVVSSSLTKSTTTTDIMVFLLFHSQSFPHRLYVRSDKSKDNIASYHCSE